MAETHAEALPTAGADDDQAASPGPIATGPTSPTQFRRAARRPLPKAFQHMQRAMKLPSRHTYDAVYEVAVMTEEPTHAAVMFLTGCKADHARCTERVRELIAADPPDEELIQTLWAMQATGQLTDEVRSRNPTLAAAWALAEANPPPQQFQAMMAALAAQHLNAAAAGAEEAA